MINKSEFIKVHGKSPEGIGVYWFEISGTDWMGNDLTETMSGRGSLNEAVKIAVNDFREWFGDIKKIYEIKLLP